MFSHDGDHSVLIPVRMTDIAIVEAKVGIEVKGHVMAQEQPVALERMPQQPYLLGTEDDWTGVSSSVVRRRVQNRINQRAYRKRKQLDAKQRISISAQSPLQVPQNHSSVSSEESSNSDASEARLVECSSLENELLRLYNSAANRSQLDRQKLSRIATICKLGPLEQQKVISEFERWMERCQRLGSPRTDHLLVLVKFNVLRAMISNGVDLGYAAEKGVYDNDALSPFAEPSNLSWRGRSVPAALQPTRLQRQIPHHPWIDILPCPVMRDNLLLAGHTYDVMDLCANLVGFFSADRGKPGMIVWGEPWDIAGWEVTESFVKQWGWTIQGCEQLSRATNCWRERRGEEHLQVGRILHEEN